ncbi:MAG: RNA polymerase sigma factor [Syntrophaceticus sp.]|nr:RNA polymerase sigma factor [Syntrophaceticus sp.]MDD4783035.1 RNA polymerase sigma factor [Syntrophaceticus sp.]
MPVTTDDEITMAAGGVPHSIEKICLRMWKPLYRYVYYKVQNREEAEDITQETFVRVFAYWKKQKLDFDKWPGFLRTVALNILRDRWRQKKRRGVSIDFEKINPGQMVSVDEQKTVTQRLQIENALAKIGEEQRKILDLRLIQGYTVAETARFTGKSDAAVRTAQYRALKALSQILDNNE